MQGSLLVKAKFIWPLNPLGSKVSPLTPGPLHVPSGKAGSSSVPRSSGGSLLHSEAEPSTGVPAGLTVTTVLATSMQGSLLVKAKFIWPLSPLGSKVSPLTPGPLHVPSGKAGSSSVLRSSGGSLLHSEAEPSTGVPAGITVTVTGISAVQPPPASAKA